MNRLTETVFDTSGIVFPAFTLVSFAIGAFLGMLFRRVIPALAATLGVYLAVRLAAWGVRRYYPVAVVTGNSKIFGPSRRPSLPGYPWILSTWVTGPGGKPASHVPLANAILQWPAGRVGPAGLHRVEPLDPAQPLLADAVHRGRLAARPRGGAVRRDRLAGPPPGRLDSGRWRQSDDRLRHPGVPARRRAAGVGPRPVPWPGMLWVTWRQHRGLLITVLAVFCAAVAAHAGTGLRIHRDYALLTACRPAASPACQGLSDFFNSTDWHQGELPHVAVQAAPVLLAMFAGPAGGRPGAGEQDVPLRLDPGHRPGALDGRQARPARLAAHDRGVRDQPAVHLVLRPVHDDPAADRPHPDRVRHQRSSYAAWTLAAFCLGAFLGTLLRRTLAAMAATLGVYVGLAAATWFNLRDHYPVKTFWPMQLFEAGWLLVLSAALIGGTIWLVRRYAA